MKKLIAAVLALLLALSLTVTAYAITDDELLTYMRIVCSMAYSDYIWNCDFSENRTCIVLNVKMPDVDYTLLPVIEQDVIDVFRSSLTDGSADMYEYMRDEGSSMNFVMNTLDMNGILFISLVNGDIVYSMI